MWIGLRQRWRLVAPEIDASAASTHETPAVRRPYTGPELRLDSRRCLLVVLCVVACDAGAPARLVRGQDLVAAGVAVVQPDVDALARAELDQFAQNRSGFPDSGLIEADPVLVKSDLREPSGPVISAPALPSSHYALRTRAELVAEATRAHHDVTFISIDSVELEGNNATVWVGVTLVRPDDAPLGECCCSRQDKFAKRDGRWVFVETLSSICS